MQIVNTDLWSHPSDVKVITCCGTLNNRDQLVMGAGAASQAAKRYPELPAKAGKSIRISNLSFSMTTNVFLYGLYEYSSYDDGLRILLLQVKYDWSDKADLGLIGYSLTKLRIWLLSHDFQQMSINFPGVGHGGLPREQVMPLLEWLPENVIIHEYRDVTSGSHRRFVHEVT